MTQETRKRSRLAATWLALVAAAAFALAACGGGSNNGAGSSFGTGDEGSGTTPMDSGGTGGSDGVGY